MTLQTGCRGAPSFFATKASSNHAIAAQAAHEKGELLPYAASVSRQRHTHHMRLAQLVHSGRALLISCVML